MPVGGLVCLRFFICSLDERYLCAYDEEICGVGGKYGSAVALMSHECLDETLCVAQVIQSARFLYHPELDQMLSLCTS